MRKKKLDKGDGNIRSSQKGVERARRESGKEGRSRTSINGAGIVTVRIGSRPTRECSGPAMRTTTSFLFSLSTAGNSHTSVSLAWIQLVVNSTAA